MFPQWRICARCWAATPRVTGRYATPSPIFANGTRRIRSPRLFSAWEWARCSWADTARGWNTSSGPVKRGWPSSSRGWRSRTYRSTTTPRRPSPTRPGLDMTLRIPSFIVRAPCRTGHAEEAKKILGGLQKLSGSSAEFHFQQGAILAAEGELSQAATELEKALSLDRDHNGALFELAYINDLFGNDDAAVDLYKRCTERPPVPLAAWINLGVLYEDEMRFREAEQCYRQVLAHEPNHPRARLFVKDCQASKGMYYDEEAEKGYTVLKQLLEIPVTD